MSSVVPEGWISSQLGSLGVFSKGKGISKKETLPDGIPCIRYAEIYTVYDFRIKTFKSFISPITAKTSKKLTKNDIIFAGSGETVEDIGKSVAFTLDCDAYVGGDSIVLSPSSDLDSTFLSYQLNDNIRRSQLRKLGQGSSVIHIYSSGLQEVILSLPPLPEQKKIASILTSVDEVIENTQKQIDKLQDLKKATMNELLTKGIGHTEFKDSELGQIPKSWEALPLGDIVNLKQGVQVDLKFQKTEVTEGYLPFLRIENYTQNSTDIRFIPEQYARGSMVSIDDVVMVRYGATAGFVGQGQTGVLANNLFSVTPLQEQMTKPFLKLLLDSSFKEFQDAMAGGAMPALNFGMFKSIIKVVPPVDEQVKIAGYVSAIDFNIKALNKKIHQTQSLKKSLMQDLLTGKVRVTVN